MIQSAASAASLTAEKLSKHIGNQQKTYFNLLKRKVKSGGYVIFSQFALDGAKKCCGLDILNYDNNMFQDNLGDNFKLIDTYNYLYTHPSNENTRKYIYSLFKRK